MNFNGPEYKTIEDHKRLSKQHIRIRNLMSDGCWRTLVEIGELTGDPSASISAQLRHLRKDRFGGWIVERRARGNRDKGLFEYRLLAPKDQLEFSVHEKKIKHQCKHCGGTGYEQEKS